VKYPRPDMTFFFCSGCGRYAPVDHQRGEIHEPFEDQASSA
jgi:hypothetical protein